MFEANNGSIQSLDLGKAIRLMGVNPSEVRACLCGGESGLGGFVCACVCALIFARVFSPSSRHARMVVNLLHCQSVQSSMID